MKITNFGGAALISGLQQRGATQRYGTVNLEVTIDARKNLVTPGVHFYIEEYNPESNRTKIISVFLQGTNGIKSRKQYHNMAENYNQIYKQLGYNELVISLNK